jgi:hypothetical protein
MKSFGLAMTGAALVAAIVLGQAACSSSGSSAGTQEAGIGFPDVFPGTSGGSSSGSTSGSDSAAQGDVASSSSGGGSVCPLQPDGGGFSAILPSPTCNAVTVSGPAIVPTCASGEPPTAHGGTVPDGVYVLQSITFYGGCPDIPTNTGWVTWIVCGNAWVTEDVFPGADGGPNVRHYNVQQTPSGSTLMGIVACDPTGAMPYAHTWQYDVTPGGYSLMFPNGSAYQVDTFLKQ